jgi:putative membrane protein
MQSMERLWPAWRFPLTVSEPSGRYAAYAVIAGVGAVLYWLSNDHPSILPAWAPWDFSTPEYLATTLSLLWFFRGLRLSEQSDKPRRWRRAAFLLGVGAIYAVLQTHFEYWAQHMFFLNRIQHVVMHHFGPFLIALGGAGKTLVRGMPKWLHRMITKAPVVAVVRVLQQPFLAAVLFSGSFALWLIPAIHFRAMLDEQLYAVMNWTMVLDGILFWTLVLDPRPKPPARTGYGVRVALSLGVMFPQIIMGALIGLSDRDLYPYYSVCGRIFSSISALSDQHIGGIILWIPPAMMSAVGVLVVLNALRLHEDSAKEGDQNAASLATLSSSWTGR